MYLRFEHFAATSMLGQKDSPPRVNGTMHFERGWERDAFGIAIALSKGGHYEWERFRQGLIASIAHWESQHATDDPSWDYYERWLETLEHVAVESGVIDPTELKGRAEEIVQLTSECRSNNQCASDGSQA